MIQATVDTNRETFTIKDETGSELYKVASAPTLPTRKKFYVYDQADKKVGEIKRQRNNFGYVDLPRLYVETAGWNQISIIKDMNQYKMSYQIKGEGLAIGGEFLGKSFELLKGDDVIAKVEVIESEGLQFNIEILQPTFERLIVNFMVAMVMVYLNEKAQVSVLS